MTWRASGMASKFFFNSARRMACVPALSGLLIETSGSTIGVSACSAISGNAELLRHDGGDTLFGRELAPASAASAGNRPSAAQAFVDLDKGDAAARASHGNGGVHIHRAVLLVTPVAPTVMRSGC
jgi:hypothetical protein